MGKIWSTYECPLRRIRGIQRGQDEGGGAGRKMSVFDHAQGINTVHAGGGGGVVKREKYGPPRW